MTASPAFVLLVATAGQSAADTAPINCDNCAEWNAFRAPFRVYGNTYNVGVEGLSSVLVVSRSGLILLDGGLPQSAPKIAASVRTLGYRIEDVKWIVVSHPHYDHAGGIAALARMSGAQVAASPRSALVLRAGVVGKDDPQWRADAVHYPPVAKVVELADGGTIKVGEVTLTAHHTPGHTPGSTTWSWRSCDGGRCLDMVYADSVTPVSAPDFRYSDDGPRVEAFRASLQVIGALPCHVLLCPHPDFSQLFERQEARKTAHDRDPMIDPGACRKYASDGAAMLEKRLAKERSASIQRNGGTSPPPR
jgi:metallo-beta-lactamase class B